MQISLSACKFEYLTVDILYDIIQLRQEIFIVEQNCPYLDADGNDKYASHLILHDTDNSIIGYARILPPDIPYTDFVSIGRVVCKKEKRGQGFGRQLMILAIMHCKELYPGVPIKIGAQSYLKRFYTSLGFNDTGTSYIEDGIPHIIMTMK